MWTLVSFLDRAIFDNSYFVPGPLLKIPVHVLSFLTLVSFSDPDTFNNNYFILGPTEVTKVGRDNVTVAPLILIKPVDREAILNDAKILRLRVKVYYKPFTIMIIRVCFPSTFSSIKLNPRNDRQTQTVTPSFSHPCKVIINYLSLLRFKNAPKSG